VNVRVSVFNFLNASIKSRSTMKNEKPRQVALPGLAD